MLIETSLFFKTMIILSGQLGIVLATCVYCIKRARKAYENNSTFLGLSFRASMNMKKKLDLVPYTPIPDQYPVEMTKFIELEKTSWSGSRSEILQKVAMNKEQRLEFLKEGFTDVNKNYSIVYLFLSWAALLFACLYFSVSEISTITGIFLFSAQSIAFGPLLALIMLEMDENDGYKALQIVFLVTIATGVIGYSDIYSFSESAYLASFLFISLLGLIIFGFIRIFIGFSRKTVRAKAIFGAFIFTLFLLYDFNYLKKSAELGFNNWETAFSIAFTLYLDIVNLLLEILDAMSN